MIPWSDNHSVVGSTTAPSSLTKSTTSAMEVVVIIIARTMATDFRLQQWVQEVVAIVVIVVVHQVHPSLTWLRRRHHFLHFVGQTVLLPRPSLNRQCITTNDITFLIPAVCHNDRRLHLLRKVYLARRLEEIVDIRDRYIGAGGTLNGPIIQVPLEEGLEVEGHEVVAGERIIPVAEVCRTIRFESEISFRRGTTILSS